jgi:hypothetical protein
LCLLTRPAPAQETAGSGWARVGGGALGLYSGAVLGVAGSLIPCSQTLAGVKCVRAAGVAGGVIGLAGGVYLGDADAEAVASAFRGAGYGLLAGSLMGFTLKEIVPHYGWADVFTAGAVGAAIGASAPGAAIGLAAGVAVGTVLWWAVPSFELADAMATGFVGMAVGGLAGWIVRAVDARSDAVMTYQVRVPLNIAL